MNCLPKLELSWFILVHVTVYIRIERNFSCNPLVYTSVICNGHKLMYQLSARFEVWRQLHAMGKTYRECASCSLWKLYFYTGCGWWGEYFWVHVHLYPNNKTWSVWRPHCRIGKLPPPLFPYPESYFTGNVNLARMVTAVIAGHILNSLSVLIATKSIV